MLNNPVTGEESPQQANVNSSEIKQNHASGKRGMYSSITIENFRLFEHLELDDLARVNLLFGPNNSGKTSVLEALFTHACGLNFVPFQRHVLVERRGGVLATPLELGELSMLVFRDRASLPYTFTISAKLVGDPSTYRVTSTFYPSSELADLDPRTFGQFSGGFSSEPRVNSQANMNQIQVIDDQIAVQPTQIQHTFLGKWQIQLNEEKSELDLSFPPSSVLLASAFKLGYMNDPLSHRSPTSERKVFSHLKRYGILDEFAEEMGRAFPEVRKIDMIPYPDGTPGPVYVEVGDQRLPLFMFGDGMRRWFHLIGHMLVYKNALHCIDEIDAFFHPDARRHLARFLIRYAEKFGNQLFLTSHSIEFADAFLEALYGEDGVFASGGEDPVRVFTIRPTKDYGHPEVWKLTGREAYKNRSYYDLELR